MADYSMTLTLGSKTIIFPVAPPVIEVSSPGDNETAKVLELGEVLIQRKKKLQEIAWESFFPANMGPYVTGRAVLDPMDYVDDIQDARDRRKHGRFCLSGDGLNITMTVAVDDFSYKEQGGEVGDIYYKIKLKEFKSPGAITISTASAAPKPQRSGTPAKAEQQTYTVKPGDSMWTIAQSCYNDGSRYPELYQKNKALIDARNEGHNVPKYTIYAGQVLVL